MIWSRLEKHTERIIKGEREGRCPGCGRETDTFTSIFLPNRPLIGCCCADCIDGETIERLDPRLNAAVIKAVLEKSGIDWRERLFRRVAKGEIKVEVPAGYEEWSEEERLIYCGREILGTLREMYDDGQIWRYQPNFAWWVDKAPLPKEARKAVELARRAEKKK